jgi:hypothetical protein
MAFLVPMRKCPDDGVQPPAAGIGKRWVRLRRCYGATGKWLTATHACVFFDILRGLVESSVRSDMFVVPKPNESASPVGAAWSDDAAPERSLDGF